MLLAAFPSAVNSWTKQTGKPNAQLYPYRLVKVSVSDAFGTPVSGSAATNVGTLLSTQTFVLHLNSGPLLSNTGTHQRIKRKYSRLKKASDVPEASVTLGDSTAVWYFAISSETKKALVEGTPVFIEPSALALLKEECSSASFYYWFLFVLLVGGAQGLRRIESLYKKGSHHNQLTDIVGENFMEAITSKYLLTTFNLVKTIISLIYAGHMDNLRAASSWNGIKFPNSVCSHVTRYLGPHWKKVKSD